MQLHQFFEMFVWVLHFAACLSFALSNNAGLPTRINDNKQIGKIGAVNGTRGKRAPNASPQPTPQILSSPDSTISKRQFMPVVPDLPRREFLPGEPGTLLPTPRIIRPLVLEHPVLPLERAHFMRGPLDLEQRPFVGQGIVGQPLLPEFRRVGVDHQPLLREAGPPLLPFHPVLEPKHIFLEPHRNHFFGPPISHLAEGQLHFGSLGDTPLLPMPRRHHFQEGFIAPQIPEALPEGRQFQEGLLPELRQHHPIPTFDEGLVSPVSNGAREAAQLRHRLKELEQLSSRLHGVHQHNAKPSFIAPSDSSDGSDDGNEDTAGDDSIESMMNELNKHKSGKAWVTDVNIFDKKRKHEDLASLLEADDKDDEDTADFDPCAARPCKNGAICRAKENSRYECICTRNYKGKHCTVRNRCFPNPCHNRGRCTETISGFECTCEIGYKGRRCSEKNYCLPNPCFNDGLCNESPDGYVCTCSQGFQGKTCEVKRSACNPNPCLNNAQCIMDGFRGFQCVCLEGYSGKTCDVFGSSLTKSENGMQRSAIAVPDPSQMACLNNPCMNNGLCRPDPMSEKGFKCSCVAEYKGILCEEKLCSCENNGFCVMQGDQSKCICKAGYAGDKCEKHTQCNDDTCMHGGVCHEDIGSFKCKCEDGYKGQRCEAVDHCNPSPCLHGGMCKDLRDTFQCECPKTYKGKQCEDFNFCYPNPCQNGGTCFGYSVGFQCDCMTGFTGKNCENKLYCTSNPCKNGGQCVEVPGNFKCLCGQGFSGNTCEVHNYCASNPCRNGGTCLNQATGFKCTCTERFLGNICDVFNECFEQPCKNGGKCEVLPHSGVKCTCTIGFAGPHCEQVDECQPNPCKNDGTCSNNPNGGFTCNCKEGYRGLVCAEPDPCHPNPCHHGVCSEINGGYVCNCTLGFRGPVCSEIDRCNPNPCQHGAPCEEINGGVGYVCQCPVGYKGQICDLKDPCNPSPCQNSGSCIETVIGSGYSCKCQQGWIGGRCEAKDPCYPNPCQHEGACLNDGKNAFKCNCTQGFKGTTCDKIDLCSPNPCRFGSHCIQTDEESYQCVKNLCTPNPCKHSGKCIVVNDEGFECACHNGWRGRNCEDYDPCFSNPCLNGGTCSENTNGGFSCLCSKNFEGKYCGDAKVKAKPEARWCTTNPCTNGGTCIETDGTYNCRCPLGYSGTICEESVCTPNPCENGGLCVPYYGIALCKCTHDYTGAHCSEKRRTVDSSHPLTSTTSQYNYVPAPPETKPAVARGLQGATVVTLPSFSLPSQYQQAMAANAKVMNTNAAQPVAVAPSSNVATIVSHYTVPSAAAIQAPATNLISMPAKLDARTDVSATPVSSLAVKKDETCVPSPCQHNGMCVMRTDSTPECVCPSDFSGPFCQEIGTYGYSSAPKFFPKDECSHCDENAICVNSHCICKPKYVGDGLECWAETQEDKDWSCDRNPCQNGGTCKYGRAKCVCRLGYTGDYCQNYCPPLVHLSFDKMRGSLAFDESGNNNDAMLINGAELAYEGGKCDSGVSLSGGDILFDGERFWPKPVEAITIALWVKLDTNKGIQSIFDTVGQKFSNHKEGQYHVEIENGKIRWFHRNEKHTVVFSIMSQPLVSEGLWHHIAGTYDAQKSIAKLFLNGDMVARGSGNGYLSQDWTGKAGIGKHEHPYGDRLLRGMVDEFFIFGCALPRLEILVLMHHCKIYFGKKKDYSKSPLAVVKHNATKVPADHWVYTVAENVHTKGDTRTGIEKPGNPVAQRKQQQPKEKSQQYKLPNKQQSLATYTRQGTLPGQVRTQNTANAKPGFMDFKSLWEAWKEKKRQEEAAKKSLNAEETMIEKVYQSLFGNKGNKKSSQQIQTSFSKPASPVATAQHAAYNEQRQGSGNYNGVITRGRVETQPQVSFMPMYNLNYPQYQMSFPNYGLTSYQKKDFAQYYKAEMPSFSRGQPKSSMPSAAKPVLRRIDSNMKYSAPASPKILKPVAPKRPDMNSLARQSYFRSSPQNSISRFAPQTVQAKVNSPALSRATTFGSLQNELQRLRQMYSSKRAEASRYATNNSPRGPEQWPAPNSVEEFATNRGIVRIQSVVRPIAGRAQLTNNQPQLSRDNSLSQPRYENPWSMYNRLKSGLSSKRDNYKAADSHAATATTSNTWEGATAPGQKGAGHNYGYGYGYGTGDALKGGGWGQGFGGGGPGVNENGNHHTPDFNNPNMQWGQGQGWGQGGKGIKQQEQYKPAPPSGASLYPKITRQSQAPVRHIVQNSNNPRRKNAFFLPKGPSIMNFEPSLIQLSRQPNIKNNLLLRGNMPVSSPAYQVKYFTANDASTGYPNDPARSMRNEIISNAVADVLRSIQKKKRKRTAR